MQAWGLIVLLVSKAAGQAPNIPEMEQDKSAGVMHSQRALAEVCEMIRISHLVHQGLVNLQPLTQAGQDLSLHGDMTFGNKIALLSGDYLLGNSCAELAGLRYDAVHFQFELHQFHSHFYSFRLFDNLYTEIKIW